MLGMEAQEAVDTTSTLGYDNIYTSQEGAIDYGTGAENVIGGNGRNTEVNPGVLSFQGTANSGGNVRPGDPGRIPGGYGEGTIHTSDNKGREVTAKQAELLHRTAVADENGAPIHYQSHPIRCGTSCFRGDCRPCRQGNHKNIHPPARQ